MNAQLKQLIEKHNKLCRDLRTNHKQRLETNCKITRLTEEPKMANWHRHFEGFSNLKMPSGHGLLCAPYLEGSLTPLESPYCTKVECTPAIVQMPQHSFKSTQRSAVAKVTKTPGKQSWISYAINDPHVQPRSSRWKRPSPPVNFSRCNQRP